MRNTSRCSKATRTIRLRLTLQLDEAARYTKLLMMSLVLTDVKQGNTPIDARPFDAGRLMPTY